jgi:hypothetical protein
LIAWRAGCYEKAAWEDQFALTGVHNAELRISSHIGLRAAPSHTEKRGDITRWRAYGEKIQGPQGRWAGCDGFHGREVADAEGICWFLAKKLSGFIPARSYKHTRVHEFHALLKNLKNSLKLQSDVQEMTDLKNPRDARILRVRRKGPLRDFYSHI